jgi:2,4-dienoyl-CoA reductase-like NADH-dependent reductase (Old Yellow Enzyme family)
MTFSKPKASSPLRLGPLMLTHRIGRVLDLEPSGRAEWEAQPNPDRAFTGGLVLSPLLCVLPSAAAPEQGLHTTEQANRWRHIAESVHAHGGKLVARLWLDRQPKGMVEIAQSHLDDVIEAYRRAAEHAWDAGLDGTEIVVAEGGIVERILSDRGPHLPANYGPSALERFKVLVEVVQAVIATRETACVALCVAHAVASQVHSRVVELIRQERLAYLHIVLSRVDEAEMTAWRTHCRSRLIFSGPFSTAAAVHAIESGLADGIVPFMAA